MSEVKSTDIYMEDKDFKLIVDALNMASLMEAAMEDECVKLVDLDMHHIPHEDMVRVIHEGHRAVSRAKYRP